MKISKSKALAFAAGLRYSKEGLLPVAVCDSESSGLLMLAYASSEAVVRTLTSGSAWFFSRERRKLWKKGETSGNTMKVISVASDCDNDALQYVVQVQGKGKACHKGSVSCFSDKFGGEGERLPISKLASIIEGRLKAKPSDSYTAKLASSRKLACAKIDEESGELVEALQKKDRKEVAWEACDLIYHSLVAARARGVRLSDLEKEFARRNRKK